MTASSRVTFVNHDGGTWVFRQQPQYKGVIKFGRITIHDNCFIGHGVVIMPGVSIGPNSVVGTGAVVTKDVPPNTVAVGIPAKPIMTVEEYAEKSLANTPDYDKEEYKNNKRDALVKLYPYPW
ncbi:MAG: acyltransferase [Armatimonadetes bacterium]|nr:acyltransferase [Armatimonadota bacterium]